MCRKIIVILGVSLMLFSLVGCKQTAVNDSAIVSFDYAYNGSIGGDSYEYHLEYSNNQYILHYESMLYPDYGELLMPVASTLAEDLRQLYLQYDVQKWNGFKKVNSYVLDGDGFSLNISFGDGRCLVSHGSNAFPEAYGEFKRAMDKLLAPYVDKMKEEKRQQIINRGINGHLDFMMVNFKQQGNAGSDEYSVFICTKDVRDNNFDASIKSVSGEFMPKGEYRYYCTATEEAIDFAAFEELIRTYEIIKWYNYDKTAEDYANSEWFQLDFGFDDGFDLNAYGTRHPDNYEEFRAAFLSLLSEKLIELETAGEIVAIK